MDVSGRTLPDAPKWNLNGVVDYSHAITDQFDGFIRGEWTYRSSMTGSIEGVAAPILGLPNFPYVMPSYNVFNLRLGLNSNNVSLQGYVENLFDKSYYTGTGDGFGLAGIRVTPHPRIWGLKITFKTN